MKSCHVTIQIILLIIILSFSQYSSTSRQLTTPKETNDVSLLCGPYSQWQQPTSINIIWQTTIPTLENYVRWGTTPACPNTTPANQTYIIQDAPLYTASITALQPSTKYYYYIISDTISSPIYSFHTQTPATESISFAAFGDTRGAWDDYQSTYLIAKAIEQHNLPFIIHTGDIVDNGINPEEWISYFTNSSFIHNTTLYPVLGNHEQNGRSYYQYFHLGNNERWYSFNNGPICFIGLDSNLLTPFRLAQNLWLIHKLRINEQPFTIIFFHYPLYSSGEHGSTTYLRWLWQPLFQHFNVDVVLNGHDHHYERAFVHNITYIVTGGGGAPLRDVGSNWWTMYAEKTFHYCLITADATTLEFQALNLYGIPFDAFTLQK